MSLNEFLRQKRDQLDDVDRQITKLLEKRFELSTMVIKKKKENGMDVYDADRENDIYNNIRNEQRKFLRDNSLRAIFERILDESRRTGLE